MNVEREGRRVTIHWVMYMCMCVFQPEQPSDNRLKSLFKASIDDLLYIWALLTHKYTLRHAHERSHVWIFDIFSIVSNTYYGLHSISMRHIDITFGNQKPNIFIFHYLNIESISFVKQHCFQCNSIAVERKKPTKIKRTFEWGRANKRTNERWERQRKRERKNDQSMCSYRQRANKRLCDNEKFHL